MKQLGWYTGCTNVNFLYFPDSMEIGFLEELTLWCSKINQSKWPLIEIASLQRLMKIVHQHANGSFDWLIFEHRSVNPSKEAVSILSGKYKRFTFVHPMSYGTHVDSEGMKSHSEGDDDDIEFSVGRFQ